MSEVYNAQVGRRRLLGGAAGLAGATLLGGCTGEAQPDPEIKLPADADITAREAVLLFPPDGGAKRNVIFRPVRMRGESDLIGLIVDKAGVARPVRPPAGAELRMIGGSRDPGLTAARLLGVTAIVGKGLDGNPTTVQFVTTSPQFEGTVVEWPANDTFDIRDALGLGGVGLQTPVPNEIISNLGPPIVTA